MNLGERQGETTPGVLRVLAGDAAILLAVLLATEVALRVLWPQPLHRILDNVYEVSDRDPRGYLFRPGARAIANNGFGDHPFEINSWRARDREYLPKQVGEWRILCLGDSFNENQALAVEDIYPKVLESRLAAAHPRRRFTVINAGMAGWRIGNFHAYIERMSAEIEPDVVVIGVNLVGDMVMSEEPWVPAARSLRMGLPVRAEAGPLELMRWSVWYAVQVMESRSHAFVAFRRLTRDVRVWLKIGPMLRWSPLHTDPEAGDREIELTTEAIRDIRELTEKLDARLMLMNMPLRHETTPEGIRKQIQLDVTDLTQLDVARPARLLAEIAANLDLSFYDPSADLAASEQPTYFPVFLHWNARGNRVVASGLQRALRENALLGPAAGS